MNLQNFFLMCGNDNMYVDILYFDKNINKHKVTNNITLRRIYNDAKIYLKNYAINLLNKEIKWFAFDEDKIIICLKYYKGIEEEL